MLAEEAVEQGPELGLLNCRQQLAQVALEALERDLGADGQVLRPILPLSRLAQRRELDLRPPSLADLEGAVEVDDSAGSGERVELLGILPADRLGAAAGVGDGQPQPGLTVALAPQLALADREGAFDPLPVLELAQGHALRRRRLVGFGCGNSGKCLLTHPGSKVKTGADESGPASQRAAPSQ